MAFEHAAPRALTFTLCATLLVLACATRESAAPAGVHADSVAAAEAFVAALGDGDVTTLTRLARAPFAFREQEWTNATDGWGFVLGAARDRTITDPAELAPFFANLVERVSTQSRSAAPNPSPRETLLAEQLAGAPSAWRELDLLVFLRGEGDVEHIAIVGVDRKSRRVAGLYVN